jgi:hypothetical protein
VVFLTQEARELRRLMSRMQDVTVDCVRDAAGILEHGLAAATSVALKRAGIDQL